MGLWKARCRQLPSAESASPSKPRLSRRRARRCRRAAGRTAIAGGIAERERPAGGHAVVADMKLDDRGPDSWARHQLGANLVGMERQVIEPVAFDRERKRQVRPAITDRPDYSAWPGAPGQAGAKPARDAQRSSWQFESRELLVTVRQFAKLSLRHRGKVACSLADA